MLNVDGNENGKKKNNKQQQTKTKTSRCNLAKKKQKKTSLHLQHSFWYTSLPLLLQRETSELHVVWRKCRMCTQKILLLVFLLAFFHCPSFLPYCPLAVLISFRRCIMLFFQRNSSPLLSFKISLLALCRSSVLVELP